MKLVPKILFLIYLTAVALVPTRLASAQEIQKIVAIVNDDIISGYDVIQRINLNIFMAGLPANNQTRQQLVPSVIKTLIDDQLKLQEAKRRNTEAADPEIDRAIGLFEKRFNIRPDQFENALATIRVSPEAVIHQIRASIGWDKLVRRRIIPKINVTESEIKSKQEEMRANKGKTEYLLREIFLAVDVGGKSSEVQKSAQNLYGQLKQGANFARVATQFSDGPTAANGGLVGWQMAEEMPPEIARTVLRMADEKVSEPIRTNDGFYIVAVSDTRKILDDTPSDAMLELSQLVLPIAPAEKTGHKDAQVKLAKAMSKFVNSCEYVPALVDEMSNRESGVMGKVQLSKLPDNIKSLVENLKAGEASEPYLDKGVYRVFIVCDRTDANTQSDSVEAVRQLIGATRIESRVRRYLNDLRREASIETR